MLPESRSLFFQTQDEVPLKNSYKEAVFAFLRRAMPTSEDDHSDILGNRAMQDEFFDAVLESLARKDMHAFLKLFRPDQQV